MVTMSSPTRFRHEVDRTIVPSLVWQLSRRVRRTAHLSAGHRSCATVIAPYSPQDPNGRLIREICVLDGCLDIAHDIIVSVSARLAADSTLVRDDGRYVNSIVSREVSNYERSQRAALGLPAKPTRSDGVAGKVIAELNRRAATENEGEWLVQLFRMIRAHVCRMHQGNDWPIDHWLAIKYEAAGRLRLERPDERAEIKREIVLVLATAREVAGQAWVHHNILHPLLANRYAEQIDDAALTLSAIESEDPFRNDADRFGMAYILARRKGDHAEEAFRTAFTQVFDRNPPPLSREHRRHLLKMEHDYLELHQLAA